MAAMALSNQIPVLQSCSPHTFQSLNMFGAEFTHIQTSIVTNQTAEIAQGSYSSHFARTVTDSNFCNVTVTYTHPGQNDNLNVQVWLPLENWNERLQGSGGGGYQTGIWESSMRAAVDEGYAVTSTDGGHFANVVDPTSWALISPGNVNLYALQNFASVSLNEASIIGKQVTKSFYGQPPKYSYWNGCSTGGRQGLMLAQRYPEAYDGILAAAPAINFASFLVAEYWPQLVMNELNSYPHHCEFDAITAAAIAHCDPQDGVKDNIMSTPELCNFNPHTLVGTTTPCPDLNTTITITEAAATVALAAWTGALTPSNDLLWPGLNPDAQLSGPFHLASTICTSPTNCTGSPFPISESWIETFLERGDPNFDIKSLTRQSLTDLLHKSVQIYDSIISANDPDLSPFKRRNGKMITWHGLSDPVIFPNGSRTYYEKVKALDPEVEDYYRYFEAPGVAHCSGGSGPYPGGVFEELIRWVEEGVTPDVLEAVSLPDDEGKVYERGVCMFPGRARYKGTGDVRRKENWECA